jgi:hypothetical protein
MLLSHGRRVRLCVRIREDFGVAGIVLILLAVLFGAGSLIGSTS